MKKIIQIGIRLLFFTIIFSGVGQAQDSFSSLNLSGLSDNGVLELSGTNISSFQTFSDDELTALVDVLNATPTVSRRLYRFNKWQHDGRYILVPPKSGDASVAVGYHRR